VHKEVVILANPKQQRLSAPLVHPEHPEHLGLKEKLEIQAVPDFLVDLDHKDHLDSMAHQEILGRLESVA
jgi:hypothetical protein